MNTFFQERSEQSQLVFPILVGAIGGSIFGHCLGLYKGLEPFWVIFASYTLVWWSVGYASFILRYVRSNLRLEEDFYFSCIFLFGGAFLGLANWSLYEFGVGWGIAVALLFAVCFVATPTTARTQRVHECFTLE
jgi:hypothetical protein